MDISEFFLQNLTLQKLFYRNFFLQNLKTTNSVNCVRMYSQWHHLSSAKQFRKEAVSEENKKPSAMLPKKFSIHSSI